MGTPCAWARRKVAITMLENTHGEVASKDFLALKGADTSRPRMVAMEE